jgi:predicted metal-dependent phosphoesterase TrpH
MKADLHIHSTVSDGSDSIGGIIVTAKEKGLEAICITDHDTLSHLARLPSDTGIRVIGGIEMSAVHRETNTRVHILGYNIRKPEIVTALAQPLLEARNKTSEKQADILIREGYKIDIDKLARADGKYLYKQHIMDWLVTTGQASDMFGEFYQATFKNGGICAFDIEYIDVFEAVKAIKSAGGLAVLAHPGQQQNFRLIPEFIELGLDGLELNHHSHNETDREIIRGYADRYGLFMTGGSDYHGKYEPQPFDVGDILSDESGVIAICKHS